MRWSPLLSCREISLPCKLKRRAQAWDTAEDLRSGRDLGTDSEFCRSNSESVPGSPHVYFTFAPGFGGAPGVVSKPPNNFRPSGSTTHVRFTTFFPFFAPKPSRVTASPAFKSVLFHPRAVSPPGLPNSKRHLAILPCSSLLSR